MSKTTLRLGLSSVLCGLVACGGGGGDGSGNIQPAASLADIDSVSGPVIAEAVASSMLISETLSGLSALAVPQTAQATIGYSPDNSLLPPVAAATIGPEMIDCDGGGMATFSGNLANTQTLTAGDTMTFAYTDCNDGLGTVIDGTLSVTIGTMTGDPDLGTFSLALTMNLQNFQISSDGNVASLHGDISFAFDATDQQSITMSVSSGMLAASAGNQSVTLSNYSVTFTIDPLLASMQLETEGTLAGSEFSGAVTYSTTQPIAMNAADTPVSGQMVVEGAGGATITINIVSAAQVDVEFDYDGNGTVDEVVMTTWEELNSGA